MTILFEVHGILILSWLYPSALEFRNCSWTVQNAELFTLTYGAIVRQLLTDLEEVEEVNKQLDQMYNSETLSIQYTVFSYLLMP